MSTKIVYLAHTQKRILDDAVFSILNLVHHGLAEAGAEVIVGTDKPELFENLPVTVWPISAEDIRTWKGEIDFIHRTKPMFLHLVAQQHHGSNILYFDADTAVKVSLSELIAEIERGNALMHASEGVLIDAMMPVYDQVRKAISSGSVSLLDLENSEMFNAGVIGIDSSKTDLLVELVSQLDSIYPRLRIHIIEQMLFAYLLGKNASVLDTSNEVVHWWGKGLNTGPIISEFLDQTAGLSLKERAAKAAQLLPQIESAPMNPKLSFAQKLKRSFKKRLG